MEEEISPEPTLVSWGALYTGTSCEEFPRYTHCKISQPHKTCSTSTAASDPGLGDAHCNVSPTDQISQSRRKTSRRNTDCDGRGQLTGFLHDTDTSCQVSLRVGKRLAYILKATFNSR